MADGCQLVQQHNGRGIIAGFSLMLASIWRSSRKSVSWKKTRKAVYCEPGTWMSFVLCEITFCVKEHPFSIKISTVTEKFPVCGNFQLLLANGKKLIWCEAASLTCEAWALGISPKAPKNHSPLENDRILQALHSLVFTSLITVSFFFPDKQFCHHWSHICQWGGG